MNTKLFLNKYLPKKALWKPYAFSVCLTTNCNMRCGFCMRNIYDVNKEEMSEEVYNKIMEIGKRKKIIFSGMGEPTLHPRFDDFVLMAHLNKMKVATFTNGLIRIKEETLRLISNVCFSIDEVATGHYKSEKVIENLKYVSDVIGKSKVWISVVSDGSINIRDDLKDYAKGFGVVQAAPWNKEAKYEFKIKKYCLSPWTTLTIEPDGSVYPCCIFGDASTLKDNPKINFIGRKTVFEPKEYMLGNIMTDDVKDMWNGKKMVDFRKVLKSSVKKGAGFPCSYCPLILGLGY